MSGPGSMISRATCLAGPYRSPKTSADEFLILMPRALYRPRNEPAGGVRGDGSGAAPPVRPSSWFMKVAKSLSGMLLADAQRFGTSVGYLCNS